MSIPCLSPAAAPISLPGPHPSSDIRAQVAIVRSLADQLDCLPNFDIAVEGIRAQLVEELARLGSRILETAANLSSTVDPEAAGGQRAVGHIAGARRLRARGNLLDAASVERAMTESRSFSEVSR